MHPPRSAPRSRAPLRLPSGYGLGADRQTVSLNSRHQGRCVVSVWILPYRPYVRLRSSSCLQPDNVGMAQKPNAAAQPRPEAGARHERTLLGVGCSRLFGAGWRRHPHTGPPPSCSPTAPGWPHIPSWLIPPRPLAYSPGPGSPCAWAAPPACPVAPPHPLRRDTAPHAPTPRTRHTPHRGLAAGNLRTGRLPRASRAPTGGGDAPRCPPGHALPHRAWGPTPTPTRPHRRGAPRRRWEPPRAGQARQKRPVPQRGRETGGSPPPHARRPLALWTGAHLATGRSLHGGASTRHATCAHARRARPWEGVVQTCPSDGAA